MSRESACGMFEAADGHKRVPPVAGVVRREKPCRFICQSYIIVSSAPPLYRPCFLCVCMAGVSIRGESEPSMGVNETVVDAIIRAVDGDGNVVHEIVGAMMEF